MPSACFQPTRLTAKDHHSLMGATLPRSGGALFRLNVPMLPDPALVSRGRSGSLILVELGFRQEPPTRAMDQSSIATRPSFYFRRLRHSAAGYRLIRDAIASPVQAHERRVSHVAVVLCRDGNAGIRFHQVSVMKPTLATGVIDSAGTATILSCWTLARRLWIVTGHFSWRAIPLPIPDF